MVKNVPDDVVKCFVLSTAQRYSLYCHLLERKKKYSGWNLTNVCSSEDLMWLQSVYLQLFPQLTAE